MKHHYLRTALCVVPALMALASCRTASPSEKAAKPAEAVIRERLIIDLGGNVVQCAYSDDYKHYTFGVLKPGNKGAEEIHVVRDGVCLSEPFSELLSPFFLSPNGDRLIFQAKTSNGANVCVNNANVSIMEHFQDPLLFVTFSPDGKHYAWSQIITDSSDRAPLEQTDKSTNRQRTIVTIDGRTLESFPDASDIAFVKTHSGHYEPAYTYNDENGDVWYVRGTRRTMIGPGISDRSVGFVYASEKGDRTAFFLYPRMNLCQQRLTDCVHNLYVNGQLVSSFAMVLFCEFSGDDPVFRLWSPDGRHYAFNAWRNGRGIIFRDGKDYASKQISPMFWHKKAAVPVFAPDGRLFYSLVGSDGNTALYIDDLQVGKFDADSIVTHLDFSPNGQHYFAHVKHTSARTKQIFVDGNNGAEYSALGYCAGERKSGPCFSRSGRHFAYLGVKKDDVWVLVVDGTEIAMPQGATGNYHCIDAIWFISENVLGYYRIDGTKIYRGTLTLPQ